MKNLLILSAVLTFGLISCSDDNDDSPTEMETYIDQISGEYTGIHISVDKEVVPSTHDTVPISLTVSATNLDSVIEIVNGNGYSYQLKYDDNPSQDRFIPLDFSPTPIATFNSDSLEIYNKPGNANIYFNTYCTKTP